MKNKKAPTPTDSPDEAEEKSKSVDERIPEVIPPTTTRPDRASASSTSSARECASRPGA